MIALTVAEAAAALSIEPIGDGHPEAIITSLVVDSRAVEPGTLFVALPGQRVDGHTFVEQVFQAGAAAALTSRPTATGQGLNLVVPDPLAALGRLARHIVDRRISAGLQVVGITGSQGKTSTKDLLAVVLEQSGPTVAPYGNLNNEVGVPLTVSRVDEQTQFLVSEMGARGIGHIAQLCQITPPQVGVVLNVGRSHLGEFGGQPAIAQAKGELVEALPATGAAVLNADDPLVWAMRSRSPAPVLACSVRGEPDHPHAMWASEIETDVLGRCRFRLHERLQSGVRAAVAVQLRLTGRHHVGNAVAAAGAARAVGLDLDRIGAGLSSADPRSRWRMEITERSDGVLVINDAYNANPESMRAALDTLAQIGAPRTTTTWAVLGDMLELGQAADDEHRQIGRHARRAGIKQLVVVGTHAEAVVAGALDEGAGDHARVAADKEAATAWLLPRLTSGDVVLVKASRGLALDTVADAILAASTAPQTDNSEGTA